MISVSFTFQEEQLNYITSLLPLDSLQEYQLTLTLTLTLPLDSLQECQSKSEEEDEQAIWNEWMEEARTKRGLGCLTHQHLVQLVLFHR